jgi:hypothetical protein
VAEVVRLPNNTATLRDAADAFLDQHELARSTRRVYRASLARLVAGLGPATAVDDLSGPTLADWFAAATPRRHQRPGTGSWPPSGPQSPGGATAAGLPPTQRVNWSAGGNGSTAPEP